MSDFAGDSQCVTHHACDCIQRKADAYDSLRSQLREAKSLAEAVSDYAAGRYDYEMATGSLAPDDELSQLCAQAVRLSKLLSEEGQRG